MDGRPMTALELLEGVRSHRFGASAIISGWMAFFVARRPQKAARVLFFTAE